MDTNKTSDEINQGRRRFFGTAATSIAAVQFLLNRSADAQPSKVKSADVPKVKPGTNTSFAALRQIVAGVLNIGYAEAGSAGGPVIVLLHGWPYDIYSFVDVAPLLASSPICAAMARRGFSQAIRPAMASNRWSPPISLP